MPFITEEIYCTFTSGRRVHYDLHWPVYKERWIFQMLRKQFQGFKEVVRGIRNIQNRMNVPNTTERQFM